MAWGTPTNIGTKTDTTGATCSLTGVTVPAGVLICVAVLEDNNDATETVTDSAGNTYANAAWQKTGAGFAVGIWFAYNVTALSSGSITYHRQNSAAEVEMSAFYISGEQISSSPLDLHPVGTTGSSTSPSITSGSPAAASELMVACVAYDPAGGAFTQASGFAAPFNAINGSLGFFAGGNQISSASVTFAPHLATSIGWIALLASFKQLVPAFPMPPKRIVYRRRMFRPEVSRPPSFPVPNRSRLILPAKPRLIRSAAA